MNSWKQYIGKLILVKQYMQTYDEEEIWDYYLPEIAASDKEIKEVENNIGFSLDDQYKAFLQCANGWKSLYQSVDLFGTKDLMNTNIMKYSNDMLNSIDNLVIKESGFSKNELLPIAVTTGDRDLFVITNPKCKKPGMIIWYAGEEIDRFENFEEYFLTMIEYNEEELEYLKNKIKHKE